MKEHLTVRMEKLAPMQLLSHRHIGAYHEVGAAWESLLAWAWQQDWMSPQTARWGIPYDDPEITPENKLRYDACLEIPEGIQPPQNFTSQNLAGGWFAVTTYSGSVEKLEEAYAWIFGAWLPGSGYKLRDEAIRERYLNEPDKLSPPMLLTDIYLAVEKI